MGGGGSISVVLKLKDSKVHSVAHTDSEEAAFTFIQADSAAWTVLMTACIRFRGGSRNVEGGVLIVNVQGRRKHLVVALAVYRGA